MYSPLQLLRIDVDYELVPVETFYTCFFQATSFIVRKVNFYVHAVSMNVGIELVSLPFSPQEMS